MLLLLPNLIPSAHRKHLVTPALTVLAERCNIMQRQINLLDVLVDDVIPASAWSIAMSSPIYRWQDELVDESGRMVITSLQKVIEPANTALINGANKLLIRHTIRPVYAHGGSWRGCAVVVWWYTGVAIVVFRYPPYHLQSAQVFNKAWDASRRPNWCTWETSPIHCPSSLAATSSNLPRLLYTWA